MIRILMLLVGMLSTSRPGGPGRSRLPSEQPYRRSDPAVHGEAREDDDTWVLPPRALPAQRRYADPELETAQVYWDGRRRRIRRQRVSRRLGWAAVLVLVALIFRKVIAWAVLAALSAALHLVGLSVRLPHVTLAWPWQSIASGTTTDTPVGPWVLQKIEGISRPALGTENFSFTFTHKVSKSIGFWPCWYSSTFATVGHASATVDLNPGPAWWAPSAGHYQLRVLSRPATGVPGRVSVMIVLPGPQLPQSVHDVSVDDTLSHPIDVQHSWTYPGLGCGALIRPQFSVAVLYAQAQSIAFSQVKNDPQISGPLISAAKAEATQIVRDNFIQPTVNALGYTLAGLSIRWSGAS